MDSAFKIVVTDAKGKVSVKTAGVGGGNLDAEGVKQMLLEANTFPGCRSIEVLPSNEKLPAKLQDLSAYIQRAKVKAQSEKPVEATVTQAEGVQVQEDHRAIDRVTRSHLPDMTTMPGAIVKQAAKPAGEPGEPADSGSPKESKASPGVAPAKQPPGGPPQR
jgi:hypothetical protein